MNNKTVYEKRQENKKKVINCINNGFVNKRDICDRTGINIHVLMNLWIDKDVQEVLKNK